MVVEGNHYFPRTAVRDEYLAPSTTQTICPWKGTAGYHSIVVNGETNTDAAWYYPNPQPQRPRSPTMWRSGVASG